MLTSVGLDHTEWLGETELEIAAEKLAVLRDQRRPWSSAGSARRCRAWPSGPPPSAGRSWSSPPEDPGEGVRLSAAGAFQRRNFALAMAAAEAYLAAAGRGPLDPERVAEVAATLTVPGRLEQLADDPPTFVDVAHNPDGARALAEALPEVA